MISIFKDIQTCNWCSIFWSEKFKRKKKRQSIFNIPIAVPKLKIVSIHSWYRFISRECTSFFILCLFFLIVIVRHRRIPIAHFSWFECVSLSLTHSLTVCVPYIYAKYCLYSQCILHVWLLLRVRFICRPFVVVVFFRWIVRVFFLVWE